MPVGVVKSPKDEKKWASAKKAASKTMSEASDGDRYWALVMSIFKKMAKSEVNSISDAIDALSKARQKMSDEYDPNEESYEDESEPETAGMREFDPEADESEDWLAANDPEHAKKDEYEEYDSDEDEDAHQRGVTEDLGEEPTTKEVEPEDDIAEAEAPKRSRFEQPSKEDITAMRAHTRPWEQRARDIGKLQADPSQNPVLAHQGNIIEARNKSHGDRKAAYQALTSSKDYQSADPIAQMEMDDKFESNWRSQNPEHLKSAMQTHHAAHLAGEKGHEKHAAAKEEKIRNVLEGGLGGGQETFSTEAGLQHAGGARGEEGTEGSITQDPAAAFAMGNQEFIKQYAKDYAKKGKKVHSAEDMEHYDEGSKRDISRILGPAPAKDPKFEQFFAHYHPLIGMSAKRVIKRLGLDLNHPDVDMSMLHEAGMHGLVQSINDYDHENPSGASFATHAGHKIRGLQLTALKNQDKIPAEIRQAQKKFKEQKQSAGAGAAQVAAPTTPQKIAHTMIAESKHPKAPDMADRLKRVNTARAATVIRRGGIKPQGGSGEA